MNSKTPADRCRWCGEKIKKNLTNKPVRPFFHSQWCAAQMGVAAAKQGYTTKKYRDATKVIPDDR